MDDNVSDDDVHRHCLSCVSSLCSSLKGCSLVQCPHCMASLHACKLDDHLDNLCANSLVPCCNRHHGCDAMLQRRSLGMHLEHCPASVLQCCFAYVRCQHSDHHRRPNIGGYGCGRGKASDFSQLILERKYERDLMFIKSRPTDPLIRNTFDDDLISVDCNTHLLAMSSGRIFNCEMEYFRSVFRQYDSSFSTFKMVARHVFVCGLFVKRKDFADHYKKHNDLCAELSFKIRHCPLYHYGCLFECTEIKPSRGVLEYNPTLNSFFIKGSSQELHSNDGCLLLMLPVEIQIHLFSFVDCFGLWNVSQTCEYFRNLCEECFLPGKGIVYRHWEKVNGKWTNLKQVRTFPRTSPSTSWKPVSPHEGTMSISSHLENGCQAVKPTQWMSYTPNYVVDLLNSTPMKVIKKEEMEKQIENKRLSKKLL